MVNRRATARSRTWFINLTEERKKELHTSFLNDYRDVSRGGIGGVTNEELLARWPECPNAQGIRYAAEHLGEPRNRVEIRNERGDATRLGSTIEARLSDLIQAGALNESSLQDLRERILEEFSEQLNVAQRKLTEEQFLSTIERLIWTEGPQGTLTALKESVKSGLEPENFHQYHAYIPLAMIEAKTQELTGLTNILHPVTSESPSARGIQRFAGRDGLKGSEKFELPSTSFREPCEISTNAKDWNVMVINGANIGLRHSRLIEENPVRRALAEAEHGAYDAVVLTNIIDVETRKAAGPSRVLRSLTSGIAIDVEGITSIDPNYQATARRILEASLKNREEEEGSLDSENPELLYLTAAEIFRQLMRGWRKITNQPRPKKPEYSGNVYVVLGINEERLIAAAAYWEIHYVNLIRQHQLRAEIRTASSAHTRLDKGRIGLEAKRVELEAELAHAEDSEKRQQLREVAENIERINQEDEPLKKQVDRLRDLEARTRITNISPEEWEQYYNRALGFFVQNLENPDVIPNCKVIGKGTTHVRLGEQVVKLLIPGHTRITDGLLSECTNVHAPEVLRGEMADITVICHPYSLGARLTAREADVDGSRRAVKVCVAPICVDTKFIRQKLSQLVSRAHPIEKVAFNPLSSPGVLSLNCIDGVTNVEEFPLGALAAFERHAKRTHRAKASYQSKYIWIKIATDMHWGGKSTEFVTCHACRMKLTMSDAVFHSLRHAGYNNTNKLPPIHMYSANDDPTQGHHFPAENEPHANELLYPEIEEEMRRLLEELEKTRNRDKRNELTRQMAELALSQHLTRGVYSTTQQILLVQNYLEQNVDMFDGIMRRAERAGLTIRGVSDFVRNYKPETIKDTRDLGLINFGTGNHFLKTVDGSVSEGPLYGKHLKAILEQNPYWQARKELVKAWVRGPTYGKEFIAWGTIQAKGGYEWGADFRNTPSGLGVDWGDPLRRMVRNDLRRGDYARMHGGKVTLKTVGDKHFLSSVRTEHAIYVMGPPGSHTDLFGELGFPPNNTGVVFVGLPANGPDAGPILVRALLYDDIRDIVQDNPRLFDWEKFLPNAL